MASAIIGGLLKQGTRPDQIQVVEPFEAQRTKLQAQFGVGVLEKPGPALAQAALLVWAVKPQTFREAAEQTRPHTSAALHLSVAAGIRSDSIAEWLGSQRVVRAMPNTPALIGKGITGLYARPAVSAADRLTVEAVVGTTGDFLWFEVEEQLNAVTALSGAGPAYVFYFLEAMIGAGTSMGLTQSQASQLAMATFAGATALAQASGEPPELLRTQVTSKGGTTYAALSSMEQDMVKPLFERAILAAHRRAKELGDEFGAA